MITYVFCMKEIQIDLRKINYSKIIAKHTADKWKEEHTEYSEY